MTFHRARRCHECSAPRCESAFFSFFNQAARESHPASRVLETQPNLVRDLGFVISACKVSHLVAPERVGLQPTTTTWSTPDGCLCSAPYYLEAIGGCHCRLFFSFLVVLISFMHEESREHVGAAAFRSSCCEVPLEPRAPVRIRRPSKPGIRTGIHRLGVSNVTKGKQQGIRRRHTLAAGAG